MEKLKEKQADAQEREVNIIGGKAFYVDDGTFAYLTERPAFKVEDEGSANWLMEKLSEMDGTLSGLKAQKAALIQNVDSMIADATRARDGMEYRYGPELIEFAGRNLPESKSGRIIKKTWTCPFGKVSFKDKAPRLVVVDAAKALACARERGWEDAIKVTPDSFLISGVPKDFDESEASEAGLLIEPAVLDIPKIKTGV